MAIAGLGSGMGITMLFNSITYNDIISLSHTGSSVSVTDLGNAVSADECVDFLPGIVDAGHFTFVLRIGGTKGTAADTNLVDLIAAQTTRFVGDAVFTMASGQTSTITAYVSHVGVRYHYKGGGQVTCTMKCSGEPAIASATA